MTSSGRSPIEQAAAHTRRALEELDGAIRCLDEASTLVPWIENARSGVESTVRLLEAHRATARLRQHQAGDAEER